MPRKYNVSARVGKPRGPYKSNHDDTGKAGKENAVLRSFWKTHKVEDIMIMSDEEFEAALELFYEQYEARQTDKNPRWNYPIVDKSTLQEIRNKRTNIDKGWHL